jgi:predicted dehydrogenase
MINGKLQIGIIGCGGIANQKYFPALKSLSNYCDLVAFCDIIPERAEKAAREYGVPNAKVTTDYLELLKDGIIDEVHVLTPNKSHSEITVAALESGKHVLCEKPMAINSAEAKKMLDAAKRTGKKLTVGYQNRFRRDSQYLHRVCEKGELGEIYFAKAHAVRRKAVPTWGVFMDKEQQGGGPLIDIGTHALDLTLWCMNNYKPKMVLGSTYQKLKDQVDGNLFGPWDPKEYEVEDSVFGFIKMENGASIFLEASWILNTSESKEAKTTLFGTLAGAEMFGTSYLGAGDAGVRICSAKDGELIDTVTVSSGSIAYFDGIAANDATLEAKQWFDAIIHDRQPVVLPEQAYVVTQLIEAIYESSRTGKTIEF